MSAGVLIVLLAVWGAVLLPGLIRDIRRSPVSTVDHWTTAMASLSRGPGRPVLVVAPAQRRAVHPEVVVRRAAIARRRRFLVRLLGAVAVTWVTAIAFGGWWWSLAFVALAALVLDLAALRWLAVTEAREREVLRHLPVVAPYDPPPDFDDPERDVRFERGAADLRIVRERTANIF